MRSGFSRPYSSLATPATQFCQKQATRHDSPKKVWQMKFLVRPVDAIIRQAKAHQHSRDSQYFLNKIDHWNGAAVTKKHSLCTKGPVIGLCRGREHGMAAVDKRRSCRHLCAHPRVHAPRCKAGDMF